MRVLNIAPPAQWRAFDDELSFELRRLPMRDLVEMIEGTRFQAAIETPLTEAESKVGARKSEVVIPLAELLDLGETVIERMVTNWTVQDPSGAAIPVTREAARWLISDVRGLAGWLVLDVLLSALAVEGALEKEKKH